MASSSADAHSQPKRAAPMARQSSTSSHSHVSQSPSESSHHKPAPHKPNRQHVVGHRMQRNTSFGKNLNKQPTNPNNPPRHHHRSKSGDSASVPNSPRPNFKRNASSSGIVKVANSHTGLRKNHSSGHLARQGQAKHALKSSKSEIAPPKRSLAHPSKSRQHSPDTHPTVHFDVAADEGVDDGWTEESASQSPTTTRSNTRSNSVILDPHKMAEANAVKNAALSNMEDNDTSQAEASNTTAHQTHQTPSEITHQLPDRTHKARQTNGGNSHHHSRPPDADMITSRLLQRSSSHNPPPQMSSIAATVVSDSHDARILSQSAGSTLVDTPGRELVSRFMDGDGSAGTPKGSSFLPSRNSPQSTGELDAIKRNKSMPNVAGGAETPSRAHPRRSGTSTPTDLPPSRTQQKLLLQRASSNIEPQKLIPVILPRTGGPTFLHSSMTYNANGEGRLDPRLQQQFNHVAVEYKVVRRYRNPLADAIIRIEQIPGTPRKTRVPKSAGTNDFANVHGTSSLSTSYNESGVETEGGSGTRRSRVSFDNDGGRGINNRDSGDVEGRQSFESDHDRVRNEAEEICRRLWESTEVVEVD